MTKRRVLIIVSVILSLIISSAIGFNGAKIVKANRMNSSIQLGNKYVSEGNYEEAIIEFEKAIKIDKKNIQAYIGLAQVYLANKEYDKAINIYLQAEENVDGNDKQAVRNELEKLIHSLKVEDITIECNINDSVNIPKTITININNEDVEFNITWEKEKVDTSKSGVTKIKGIVEKINKNIYLIVNVKEEKKEEVKKEPEEIEISEEREESQEDIVIESVTKPQEPEVIKPQEPEVIKPQEPEVIKPQEPEKREPIFSYKSDITVNDPDYLPNASDIGLVAIDSNGNDCSHTFFRGKGAGVSATNHGVGFISFSVKIDGEIYYGKTTFTLEKREPVFTYLSEITVDDPDYIPNASDIGLVAIDSNGKDCSDTFFIGKGAGISATNHGVGFISFAVIIDGEYYNGKTTFTLKNN